MTTKRSKDFIRQFDMINKAFVNNNKRSKDFIRQFDMINKAFVDFEMVEGRKFLPNHSVHKSWAELQASIKGEVAPSPTKTTKTKPPSKPRKRKSKR